MSKKEKCHLNELKLFFISSALYINKLESITEFSNPLAMRAFLSFSYRALVVHFKPYRPLLSLQTKLGLAEFTNPEVVS